MVINNSPGLANGSTQRPTAATQKSELSNEEKSDRTSVYRALQLAVGPAYADCMYRNFQCVHDGQATALEHLRDYGKEMPERVERGESIILFGPAGTGKDHLMMAVMREAILRHGLWPRWRNALKWLNAECDKDPENHYMDSMYWQTDKAHDMLTFSDPLPPSGTLTSWKSEILFGAVDDAYRDRVPVWLTMNVASRAEAEARLSTPIVDRIRDRALCIFFSWPSYRQPRKIVSCGNDSNE